MAGPAWRVAWPVITKMPEPTTEPKLSQTKSHHERQRFIWCSLCFGRWRSSKESVERLRKRSLRREGVLERASK